MSAHKLVEVDPNNDQQMDAFNEKYQELLGEVGFPSDVDPSTAVCSRAIAAKHLGVSESTVLRYEYNDPPVLRRLHTGQILIEDVAQRCVAVQKRTDR